MNISTRHPPIYPIPTLTSADKAVLEEIHQMRKELRHILRTPRRWTGGLRRSALAKAIQGSNSIEGYVVAEDDAAAAIDGDEPLSADEKTFAEIQGYRQALGYVLALGDDPQTPITTTVLKAMHFMMLQHEASKAPGRYRSGLAPELMEALAAALGDDIDHDPIVRSAMAHLNLVMIHPFKDGNGRMARALATLVLTRSEIGEPEFSSIEEWLGANTSDYYAALAHTGDGHWAPKDDAHLWLSFNLRAHHMQAQTVAQRFVEAAHIFDSLDRLIAVQPIPERATDALFEAVLGYRIRRAQYAKRVGVEAQTATRDLAQMVGAGMLVANGSGRGRFYTAGEPLRALRNEIRSKRAPAHDPYPWMRATLATAISDVPRR